MRMTGVLLRASHPRAVADAEHEAVDDVLDDRRDVARRVAKRTPGESTSARLVSGKARAVGEQDPRPATCETHGSSRTGGAGSHDENVETLHIAMVSPRGAPGYNGPPSRGSRVAKGGGL